MDKPNGQIAIQADGTIRVVNWTICSYVTESTGNYKRPRRKFRSVTAKRDDDDEGPSEWTFVWLECNAHE